MIVYLSLGLYHDFEFNVLSLRSLPSFSMYFCFAFRISVVTAFRFCLNFVHVISPSVNFK